MRLSCRHIQPLVQLRVDGDLPPAYRSVLDEHLDQCPACRRELASSRLVHSRLEDAYRPMRLDRPRFADSVMAQIDEAAQPAAARRSMGWLGLRRAAAAVLAGALIGSAYLASSRLSPPATRSTVVGEIPPLRTTEPDAEPFHRTVDLDLLQPVRPVVGRITRIDGEKLWLNLGEHDGIRPGVSLMAYRQTGPGEADIELVASVDVIEVTGSGSEAKVRNLLAAQPLRAGDQVATAPFEALREAHKAQLQADLLLAKLSADHRVEQEYRLAIARHRFQTGLSLFGRVEYDKARHEFEEALTILPTSGKQADSLREQLDAYLQNTEQLTGVATRPEVVLERVIEEDRVRRKLLAIEVAYRFELGRKLLSEKKFDEAIAQFELVREITKWLSPGGPEAPAGTGRPALTPELLERYDRESADMLRRCNDKAK